MSELKISVEKKIEFSKKRLLWLIRDSGYKIPKWDDGISVDIKTDERLSIVWQEKESAR